MKRWLICISLLACSLPAVSQNGLGVYSLGEAVPQNANLNPANRMLGAVVLGLPAISELGVHINNRFGYQQVFEKLENDSVKLDIDRAISHLKKKNALLMETKVPLLFIGIQPKQSSVGYTFFVNDRIDLRAQYQKELVKAVWQGTNSFVGKSIDLRKSALSATYFREYGVGVNTTLGDDLKVGARVKFVQGIYNVKTLQGMDASIAIDPNSYSYGFALKKVGVNTTGVSEDPTASYILSNPNKGIAIDVGATWDYQNILRFSASLTDLGYVRWKQPGQNFIVKDTSFVFEGVNFTSDGDLRSTIDSLKSTFKPNKTAQPYTSLLSTKMVLSGSWLLTPVDRVTLTVMNQLLIGRVKSAYALSYVKQLTPGITASGSLVKLPQQWPRPGLAISLTGGPVQYYLASDNLIGFANVAKMNTLDFKMGINFVIGGNKPKKQENLPPAHRSKPKLSSNDEGVDYPTDPRLKKPTVIRKKEIYIVITKKKEPKGWKKWFRKKSDNE